MQDRFKFRIWDKTEKEMHYNDFVITSTGYIAKLNAIYDIEYDNEKDEEKEIQSKNEFMIDNSDLDFEKDKILMQCTGLKDKNDKLIYESDIVKDDKDLVYVIEFSEYTTSFNCRRIEIPDYYPHITTYRTLGYKNRNNFEVIGNIYKNKDLLE